MFDPFSLGYFVGLKQKLLWDGWSSDVVLNKKLFRLASSQVKSTSFIQWNPFPIASLRPGLLPKVTCQPLFIVRY